eukprot:gene15167-6359_t
MDFRILFSWRIAYFSDILRRISDFTVIFNEFLDPFFPVRTVKRLRSMIIFGESWSNVESDSDIPLETDEADELDYAVEADELDYESSESSPHEHGDSEPDSDLDNENSSTLLFGVETADPVCIKLNDLIRRGDIDKSRIL